MAKKIPAPNRNVAADQSSASNTSNIIIPIILSLYLLVDCVPAIEIQDQMGLHWLLIAILNLVAGLYIFSNKEFIQSITMKPLFKNSVLLLYLVYFVISGLSLFVTINPVEGLVIYARLTTVCMALISFCLLLRQRVQLLGYLAPLIMFIVLAQSFSAVMQFYSGAGKVDLSTLVNSLQSTTGNKNIFAAALVIKTPFVIYCIFSKQGFLKYISVLSLCLALMSISLINARAAYLGILLELLIILVGTAYLYFQQKQQKQFYTQITYMLLASVIAFFITQSTFNKLSNNNASNFGTVGKRLATITDTQDGSTTIRLEYWSKAIDFIKNRPLIGVGYGNWKLYSTQYTNVLLDDNIFSKHPHNDFIEVAGETGIPNSLIYLGVFVAALALTIRTLFSNRTLDDKLIALLIFAALSGYFVDSFFNFPLERPNIQIMFVLILALIVNNYLQGKQNDEIAESPGLAKILGLVIIVFSAAGIYAHFTILKSMKSQFIVDNDLNAVDNRPDLMPKLKYEQVNTMFPDFPNIAENSETIGFKKAKYLQKQKRYEEAIKLLDSVHGYSPNTIYDQYLKCNIYQEAGKPDSAYKYAKIAFYAKPRHFYYYRMASYLAGYHKDGQEVINMFNKYNMYRHDQQSRSYFAQSLLLSGYDTKALKKVVEEGLKQYPTDSVMLNIKAGLPK